MNKKVETAVISALVKSAYQAGYTVKIHDGGEIIPCDNHDHVMENLFSVDEEHLLFFKDGKRQGWAWLVHGNEGYDVIADNSASIEPIMKEATEESDKWLNP